MRECTQETFLKDVELHRMEIIRDDGVSRHVRFKKPDTIVQYFDLITWPGHLCISGDMGTYVFARIRDMFQFFRTDRLREDGKLYINLGYWAEKILSIDKNGKIEEFVPDLARKRALDALKSGRDDTTREQRREIYDQVCSSLDNEYEVRQTLYEHFHDSWEWDLTDYTYTYVWNCYAIAWGILMYDKSRTQSHDERMVPTA